MWHPQPTRGSASPAGCALQPAPPSVVLTSSTGRTQFGAQLDGHMFITKADISSAAVAQLAGFPETGGLESRNP